MQAYRTDGSVILNAYDTITANELAFILDFETRKIAANFSFITAAYARDPVMPPDNYRFYFDSIQVLVNKRIYSTFETVYWQENYWDNFNSIDSILLLNFNEGYSSKAVLRFNKTTNKLDTATFTVKVFDRNNGVSEARTVPLIVKD